MGETRRLVSPARVFARPTADQIWLGPSQQTALSQLSRPAPIRVIVGPPSSGKTTLLQHFGTRLYDNAVVLHCRGPKDDASARARKLAAERGSCAMGSIGNRATEPADRVRPATSFPEPASRAAGRRRPHAQGRRTRGTRATAAIQGRQEARTRARTGGADLGSEVLAKRARPT